VAACRMNRQQRDGRRAKNGKSVEEKAEKEESTRGTIRQTTKKNTRANGQERAVSKRTPIPILFACACHHQRRLGSEKNESRQGQPREGSARLKHGLSG